MIKKLDLDRRNSFGILDWLERQNEPSGAKLIENKTNEIIDVITNIYLELNYLHNKVDDLIDKYNMNERQIEKLKNGDKGE